MQPQAPRSLVVVLARLFQHPQDGLIFGLIDKQDGWGLLGLYRRISTRSIHPAERGENQLHCNLWTGKVVAALENRRSRHRGKDARWRLSTVRAGVRTRSSASVLS